MASYLSTGFYVLLGPRHFMCIDNLDMITVRTVMGNPAYYFDLLVTIYSSDKYLETLLTLFKISFRPQLCKHSNDMDDKTLNAWHFIPKRPLDTF